MLEQSKVEDGKLFITYLLNADTTRVFKAWTDPTQVSKWMGPGSVVCEEASVDLRVSGAYRIAMRTDDGLMVAHGVYREIEPTSKLVFTWQWENGSFKDSLVTLRFYDVDGKTRLELVHEGLPDESVATHHNQGWTGSLDNLEEYFEQ